MSVDDSSSGDVDASDDAIEAGIAAQWGMWCAYLAQESARLEERGNVDASDGSEYTRDVWSLEVQHYDHVRHHADSVDSDDDVRTAPCAVADAVLSRTLSEVIDAVKACGMEAPSTPDEHAGAKTAAIPEPLQSESRPVSPPA